MFVNPFSELGGAEHSLLALFETLPAGVTAELVTESDGSLAARAAELNIPTRFLPFPPGYRPLATARSVRTLAAWMRDGTDLVHANSPRGAFFAGLAARRAHVPVIWHLRCYVGAGIRSLVLRRLVTRTVANSRAALANAGFGPSDSRARVIPNGVPESLLLHEPRALLRDRGGGGELPVIGMAARLDPSKGVGEFIEMARILEREEVRARFVIAGDVLGPPPGRKLRAMRAYAARLKTYVAMSSLANEFEFVGQVTDVGAFLDTLDILVMPSWNEPFGRIVIEGMARGLPVVATNAGGVPEIISGGRDGLLVAPRDPRMLAIACAYLVANPDEAWEIGECARERALRDFRAEQTTDKVLEVYDELTGRAHCLSHKAQLLEATR